MVVPCATLTALPTVASEHGMANAVGGWPMSCSSINILRVCVRVHARVRGGVRAMLCNSEENQPCLLALHM